MINIFDTFERNHRNKLTYSALFLLNINIVKIKVSEYNLKEIQSTPLFQESYVMA